MTSFSFIIYHEGHEGHEEHEEKITYEISNDSKTD